MLPVPSIPYRPAKIDRCVLTNQPTNQGSENVNRVKVACAASDGREGVFLPIADRYQAVGRYTSRRCGTGGSVLESSAGKGTYKHGYLVCTVYNVPYMLIFGSNPAPAAPRGENTGTDRGEGSGNSGRNKNGRPKAAKPHDGCDFLFIRWLLPKHAARSSILLPSAPAPTPARDGSGNPNLALKLFRPDMMPTPTHPSIHARLFPTAD